MRKNTFPVINTTKISQTLLFISWRSIFHCVPPGQLRLFCLGNLTHQMCVSNSGIQEKALTNQNTFLHMERSLLEKSRKWEKLNLSACAVSSTDTIKIQNNCVKCHLSPVTYTLSCVTCKESPVTCRVLRVTCHPYHVTNINSHSHGPSPC